MDDPKKKPPMILGHGSLSISSVPSDTWSLITIRAVTHQTPLSWAASKNSISRVIRHPGPMTERRSLSPRFWQASQPRVPGISPRAGDGAHVHVTRPSITDQDRHQADQDQSCLLLADFLAALTAAEIEKDPGEETCQRRRKPAVSGLDDRGIIQRHASAAQDRCRSAYTFHST